MTSAQERRDLAGVLIRERERVGEIAAVLRRYGLSGLADRVNQAGDGSSSRAGRITSRLADKSLEGLTTGERLRLALTELGTTWIKLGQLLSLRPDIVGVDVADELGKLQADVPPDAPGHAESVILAALGKSVDELYAAFSSDALASGSVAQVHRATTLDGREVVVKVLHDGVQRKVISDLELMHALAAFLETDPAFERVSPTSIADEFDATMRAAIDLTEELGNLQLFRKNFAEEPDVVIPEPFPDLSASPVLTMEAMTGSVLSDGDSVRAAGWDVDELAKRTTEIYYEMMFRDGVFHADPHPGNFMLRPGEIVILDFGDVGRLSSVRRRQLEELVAGFATKNLDELTDSVVELTKAPAQTDLEELRGELDELIQKYGQADLDSLDMSGLISGLADIMHRNELSMPNELSMVFRVLLLLQGLSTQIGADNKLGELAQPYVDDVMKQRLDPQAALHRLSRRIRDIDRTAAALPRQISDLMQQAREGRLLINFDVRDPAGRVDHLVDGMLVASMVVASGQLMSRQTRPMVGSVSGPGLAVAGAGFVLYRRMVGHRGETVSTISRVIRTVSNFVSRGTG